MFPDELSQLLREVIGGGAQDGDGTTPADSTLPDASFEQWALDSAGTNTMDGSDVDSKPGVFSAFFVTRLWKLFSTESRHLLIVQ